MAVSFGFDSVKYEKVIGGQEITLCSWIDVNGKIAEQIRSAYGGLEMITFEDGDVFIRIVV